MTPFPGQRLEVTPHAWAAMQQERQQAPQGREAFVPVSFPFCSVAHPCTAGTLFHLAWSLCSCWDICPPLNEGDVCPADTWRLLRTFHPPRELSPLGCLLPLWLRTHVTSLPIFGLEVVSYRRPKWLRTTSDTVWWCAPYAWLVVARIFHGGELGGSSFWLLTHCCIYIFLYLIIDFLT